MKEGRKRRERKKGVLREVAKQCKQISRGFRKRKVRPPHSSWSRGISFRISNHVFLNLGPGFPAGTLGLSSS